MLWWWWLVVCGLLWFGNWLNWVVRWCFFVFPIWWYFNGGVDGLLLVVGLSFNGNWLIAIVGLLDLVVIVGCVGLMEREEERWERR